MANPTYPQITVTPNLGLSLIGMDEVVAIDFLILDTYIGSLPPIPPGVILETNSVLNPVQAKLNLLAGTGITLVADAFGGVTISGSSSVELETNGVPNTLQDILNLKAGANITLTADAFGGVTIAGAASAAVAQNPVFKSSAYLASVNDLVLCDTSGGGFTVTLPLSASNKGFSLNVKKVSSDHNTLTIAPSGADTIDEGPAVSTYQPNTNVAFTADGITNWDIE